MEPGYIEKGTPMKINIKSIKARIDKLRCVPIESDLREYRHRMESINSIDLSGESDPALKKLCEDLQSRAAAGASLEDLMTESFALIKETSRRVLDMRPYDVQIQAAVALHRGALTEMQTGEGKTLTAVLPAFLNALSHQGVHILTFNDYLARLDGSCFQIPGLERGLHPGRDAHVGAKTCLLPRHHLRHRPLRCR